MKAIAGLALLVLASASSAATREDENGERKRRIAEMSHHMSRHLRKDGGDLSQAASAHTLRQARESDRESQGLEASAVQEKKAAHGDKIRRVAEQLGQQHRQRLHVQGAMAPEMQRAHAAQHSLADVGKTEVGRKPAIAEAASAKTRERKHSMHKLAEHMSRTFDPQAVRHDPALKGIPGGDKSPHEARTIKQFAGHEAAPLQNKLKESSHLMGMQHKMAQAAHQTFSPGAAKDEGEGESKQANDGDE